MTNTATNPPSHQGRRSDVIPTEAQQHLIREIASYLLHAPTDVRDASVNLLKILPFYEPVERDTWLTSIYQKAIAAATPNRAAPDERLERALTMVGTYLNMDPDELVALARRGRVSGQDVN